MMFQSSNSYTHPSLKVFKTNKQTKHQCLQGPQKLMMFQSSKIYVHSSFSESIPNKQTKPNVFRDLRSSSSQHQQQEVDDVLVFKQLQRPSILVSHRAFVYIIMRQITYRGTYFASLSKFFFVHLCKHMFIFRTLEGAKAFSDPIVGQWCLTKCL